MGNKYDQYHNYSADQFAENERFRQWVIYANKEDDKFWKDYLYRHPQQHQIITDARKRVELSFSTQRHLPLSAVEKLILKNTIFRHLHLPVPAYKLIRKKTIQFLKFAAIISGIVLAPIYLVNKFSEKSILITERSGANETKKIILPDSTVVLLHANSAITYSKEIKQDWEISLQGNAFFVVKHKTDNQTFKVHANGVSIAVLGTEFIVNARNKITDIVLTKGKVKVSLNNNKVNDIYMKPGEKVQLDTINKSLVKTAVNTLLYTAWTENKWNLSAATLLEISNFIYKFYGVETVFKNENTKQLKMTAVIPVTDLNSFTNIISKTLEVRIIDKNNKLYVQL